MDAQVREHEQDFQRSHLVNLCQCKMIMEPLISNLYEPGF